MGRLDGQVAFITGAARGQGRSHAIEFAKEGADLVLTDLCEDLEGPVYPMGTREQLEETARRARDLGAKVTVAKADVRKQDELDAAVAQGISELGHIDVLINNAGLGSPAGPAHELDDDQWNLLIDILLSGPWRAAKAVIPHMMERKKGCILNTSSAAGLKGFGYDVNYVAAKHGLIGLTKALAIDLAPFNVRVNAVCPGSIVDDPELDGRMLQGVAEDYGVDLDGYEDVFASYHLFPTLMKARDISRAYVYLASEDGERITGIAMPVDAGFVTK